MTEVFKASVQYNDLMGSSAADRADSGDARAWLENSGHIKAGEFLFGIEVYVSPAARRSDTDVVLDATFFLLQATDFESAAKQARSGDPISLRKVALEMSPKEFFSLFKRFNITLSNNGELEDTVYQAQD